MIDEPKGPHGSFPFNRLSFDAAQKKAQTMLKHYEHGPVTYWVEMTESGWEFCYEAEALEKPLGH